MAARSQKRHRQRKTRLPSSPRSRALNTTGDERTKRRNWASHSPPLTAKSPTFAHDRSLDAIFCRTGKSNRGPKTSMEPPYLTLYVIDLLATSCCQHMQMSRSRFG
jgi:hypothetical protein